jgi:hypothetical protein
MNLISLVIMKKFLTCSSHQIYKWRNRKGGDEWNIQHAWEERDFHTNSWSGKPGDQGAL